jgi:hypothetical protein
MKSVGALVLVAVLVGCTSDEEKFRQDIDALVAEHRTGAESQLRFLREGLTRAAAIRYAIVCNSISYVRLPEPSAQYSPASYTGECRVFDATNAAYLGGVQISAATRDTETVWVGGTSGGAYEQLTERMRNEMVAQLDAALMPLGSPEHSVWLAWD